MRIPLTLVMFAVACSTSPDDAPALPDVAVEMPQVSQAPEAELTIEVPTLKPGEAWVPAVTPTDIPGCSSAHTGGLPITDPTTTVSLTDPVLMHIYGDDQIQGSYAPVAIWEWIEDRAETPTQQVWTWGDRGSILYSWESFDEIPQHESNGVCNIPGGYSGEAFGHYRIVPQEATQPLEGERDVENPLNFGYYVMTTENPDSSGPLHFYIFGFPNNMTMKVWELEVPPSRWVGEAHSARYSR